MAKVVTKKQSAKGARKSEAQEDPRAHVPCDAASLAATCDEIAKIVATLTPPAEPRPSDLVDAMLHMQLCDGLPCGYGQEALRRIAEGYVDRNEFRVSEAFETEDLLHDLGIPDLFQRCKAVQDSVNQLYNDQNGVTLEFLREAPISDRKNFFARIPAIDANVRRFVVTYVDCEELLFSNRSTQRVQMRLGFDPKSVALNEALDKLRQLLAPFGHLPLQVGPDLPGGKPRLEPPLSPACLLARLAPSSRRG